MTALEQLTKKIHKHNPGLRGVHFFEIGHNRCHFCNTPRIIRDEQRKVIRMDEKSGGSIGEVTVTEYDQTDMPCEMNHWKPITLDFVLKAIDDSSIAVDASGRFGELTPDGLKLLGVSWILGKTLNDQTEETIKSLNTIIT